MREFLKSKIHGAYVTRAELDYEGSFGIDRDLMDQVGISPFEAIEVYNVTNGHRIKTYAIPFPRSSKEFQSNGAAAHFFKPGDKIIIVAYAWLTEQELQDFKGPRIALMGKENVLKRLYRPDWRKADGSQALTDLDSL